MSSTKWTAPLFSKSEIDRAGFVLCDRLVTHVEVAQAFEVLSNWRAAHAFPLNAFQINLRRRASRQYENAVVAQRLKRVPSILDKLYRFPSMKLSRMQDMAGCRAIVKSVKDVYDLRKSYVESDVRHQLANTKDYIADPKDSGYRGIHLVYRYQSDKSEVFNGLSVEVQVRTQLMHAWATAVETVGIFLGHALKSSKGPDSWLEFFAMVSSVFAEREGTSLVPGTARGVELKKESHRRFLQLEVDKTLTAFSVAIDEMDRQKEDAHYYLLHLKPSNGTIELKTYRQSDLPQANQDYLEVERTVLKDSPDQVVLVRADSIAALKSAYPNYFADTTLFLSQLIDVGVGTRRNIINLSHK